MMTSRERIQAVLEGKKPDRVPFDIWYTPEVRDTLIGHLHVADELELWHRLDLDKIVMIDAPYLDIGEPMTDANGQPIAKNEWGSGIRTIDHGSGGSYEEVVFFPLANATTVEEVQSYPWPDPKRYDYAAFAKKCGYYWQWTRMLFFISLFEIYCKLRPMDQSLMDLYVEEELADAIITKIWTIQSEYIERAFNICGSEIDIVYLSDDMGMQDRQLIGEDVWEARFAKPYRKLIEQVHSHGAKVFYHSDGAAFPIIKRMVDLGVDVINPIQHTCPGMEADHLINAFGRTVAFHGAVENQHILPFGTPEEVKLEVCENIATLGTYGRYICAPCHNLQPGTPIENILALYNTDRNWKS
jgi:uroporphyrinogen decarboxylase